MTAIRGWTNRPPNLARFTLVFLVGMHATFAVAMCMLNDVVYRYLWPVWFGAAAIACVFAAITLSRQTMALAGAATLTAFTGRTVAVLWSWQSGLLAETPNARVVVTLGAWVALGFLSSLVFFRGLLTVTVPAHNK